MKTIDEACKPSNSSHFIVAEAYKLYSSKHHCYCDRSEGVHKHNMKKFQIFKFSHQYHPMSRKLFSVSFDRLLQLQHPNILCLNDYLKTYNNYYMVFSYPSNIKEGK